MAGQCGKTGSSHPWDSRSEAPRPCQTVLSLAAELESIVDLAVHPLMVVHCDAAGSPLADHEDFLEEVACSEALDPSFVHLVELLDLVACFVALDPSSVRLLELPD